MTDRGVDARRRVPLPARNRHGDDLRRLHAQRRPARGRARLRLARVFRGQRLPATCRATGRRAPTSCTSAIRATSRTSTTRIQGIAVYDAHSDVGIYGRGRNWTAGLMADHYQLADYTLSESSLPFDRLPRAYATYRARLDVRHRRRRRGRALREGRGVPRTAGGPGMPREFGSGGGSRLDMKPYICVPLEGASWFFRPTLAWRYTAYQVDARLRDRDSASRARRRAACRSAASTPACTSTARPPSTAARTCTRSSRACST